MTSPVTAASIFLILLPIIVFVSGASLEKCNSEGCHSPIKSFRGVDAIEDVSLENGLKKLLEGTFRLILENRSKFNKRFIRQAEDSTNKPEEENPNDKESESPATATGEEDSSQTESKETPPTATTTSAPNPENHSPAEETTETENEKPPGNFTDSKETETATDEKTPDGSTSSTLPPNIKPKEKVTTATAEVKTTPSSKLPESGSSTMTEDDTLSLAEEEETPSTMTVQSKPKPTTTTAQVPMTGTEKPSRPVNPVTTVSSPTGWLDKLLQHFWNFLDDEDEDDGKPSSFYSDGSLLCLAYVALADALSDIVLPFSHQSGKHYSCKKLGFSDLSDEEILDRYIQSYLKEFKEGWKELEEWFW